MTGRLPMGGRRQVSGLFGVRAFLSTRSFYSGRLGVTATTLAGTKVDDQEILLITPHI